MSKKGTGTASDPISNLHITFFTLSISHLTPRQPNLGPAASARHGRRSGASLHHPPHVVRLCNRLVAGRDGVASAGGPAGGGTVCGGKGGTGTGAGGSGPPTRCSAGGMVVVVVDVVRLVQVRISLGVVSNGLV